MQRLTTRIDRLERRQPPSLASLHIPPENLAAIDALIKDCEARWPDLAAIADPMAWADEMARRLDGFEEAC